MSNHYSDPTASAAIGAVDKEIARLKKRAKYLARLDRMGLLSPEQRRLAQRQFPGIYRRLLRNAFAEQPGK